MLSLRKRALARAEGVAAGEPAADHWWTSIPGAEKASLIAVVVIAVIALLGPMFSLPATLRTGAALIPPLSPGHLLGTDDLGMDLLARLLGGMQRSLLASLIVTVIAALAGAVIGVVAGYLGGWLDSVLMRVTDLFLAFPATIIAMAVAAALGQSITSAVIGIMVVWWPLYARLVRGEVRRVVTLPHVQAARVAGATGWRLLLRHVTPAILPTVVVTASLDIGAVIMVLSSLSFIGLGTPAPAPELGRMASDGLRLFLQAWWVAVLPSLAIALLAFVFNYAGDALRILLRRTGV